ncbi:MAG: tRNA uridine-5-carboxymethylaminomethyl(34) synthesis GTPase MnmE [Clostridia bacterium]|nr:tRNA uridine-5-carboxymethylaminomethyl(34) synthesis GTPase MnmE [Clostridia bacterium]
MTEAINETIAAVATARGEGGIAIVRISGPDAEGILKRMFSPAKPRESFESHRMMYGRVLDEDDRTLDEVMAVLMRAPSTYTREDVAEIHCHGGLLSAQMVLDRALALGARVAQPGEFTRRAFLNGRIDLSRAEAVMQLIGANSRAAARASLRQLEGGVSGFVKRVSGQLTGVLALIEASTDFPDEVEEEAAAEGVCASLRGIIADIRSRCDARRARILREGASIVLAGKPNVGKSSLMNALLDQERAIVTDIPGTTRDVLTERVSIGGVMAELSDTAGQRETDDPIERIGVDRARRATDGADVIVIVLDAAAPLSEEDRSLLTGADERAIVCLNKTDLAPVTGRAQIAALTGEDIFEISAQTGAGIEALTGEIAMRIGADGGQQGQLIARRHIETALQAAERLEASIRALEEGLPLDTAAIDLREALRLLGEITGENATEAVIDRVFRDFCVGK